MRGPNQLFDVQPVLLGLGSQLTPPELARNQVKDCNGTEDPRCRQRLLHDQSLQRRPRAMFSPTTELRGRKSLIYICSEGCHRHQQREDMTG